MSKRSGAKRRKLAVQQLREKGIMGSGRNGLYSRGDWDRAHQQSTGDRRRSAREDKRKITRFGRFEGVLPEVRWKRISPLIAKGLSFPHKLREILGKDSKQSKRLYSKILRYAFNDYRDFKTLAGRIALDYIGVMLSDILSADWSIKSRNDKLSGKFEDDYSLKIRSRSVYLASDFRKQVINWNNRRGVESSVFLQSVVDNFRITSLIPRVKRYTNQTVGIAILKAVTGKSTKGSGYPWCSKKGAVITEREREQYGILPLFEQYINELEIRERLFDARDEVFPEMSSVIEYVYHRLQAIQSGELPEVIILPGMRTESGGLDAYGNPAYKQRLVWQVPMDHFIVEQIYLMDLRDAIQQSNRGFSNHYWAVLHGKYITEESVTGLSKDYVDPGDYIGDKLSTFRIAEMAAKAKAWGSVCQSFDETQFDQSVDISIIRSFYKLMGEKAELTPDEVEYLTKSMGRGQLWSPWGDPVRNGGVASGSYTTNWLDSFVTSLLCEALQLRYDLDEIDYVVNGDDVIFVSKPQISIQQIIRVGESLGLNMHPTKQWEQPQHFLFNRVVFDASGRSAVILHHIANSLFRRDQRLRKKGVDVELQGLYQTLSTMEDTPLKEEFLKWFISITHINISQLELIFARLRVELAEVLCEIESHTYKEGKDQYKKKREEILVELAEIKMLVQLRGNYIFNPDVYPDLEFPGVQDDGVYKVERKEQFTPHSIETYRDRWFYSIFQGVMPYKDRPDRYIQLENQLTKVLERPEEASLQETNASKKEFTRALTSGDWLENQPVEQLEALLCDPRISLAWKKRIKEIVEND